MASKSIGKLLGKKLSKPLSKSLGETLFIWKATQQPYSDTLVCKWGARLSLSLSKVSSKISTVEVKQVDRLANSSL